MRSAFFMQFSHIPNVILLMPRFLLFFLLFLPELLLGQSVREVRDSVQQCFQIMLSSDNDAEKVMVSDAMETILADFYRNASQFDVEFDSVPFLGQLRSDDGVVAMTCWNLAFSDGTFQYHCILRHRPDRNSVVVTVLEDNDVDWNRIQRKAIRPADWYGALYYRILTDKHRGKTYYTLLGWDGKDQMTNRKVVDVLTFQGRSVLLGASVFRDVRDRPVNRLYFEYANDVSMALNYDVKEKMIVMDHLAPEDSRLEGQYQFYGPDFSYDALEFTKGEWILHEDVFSANRGLNNLDPSARPGDFED